MDISVVLPTYNRSGMLPRALNSVLTQSLPAREIIVVDDGSDDKTSALIHDDYPQVRYCRQPHRGVSAARNTGIAHARHSWIAFLDSDDAWQPDKLAAQAGAAADDATARLVHCDETWYRDGVFLAQRAHHRKRGGYIFPDCLPRCVISPSAALLHRSLFDEFGHFDESLPACEDYDLWLRITAQERVVFVAQELVIKHGGHADQLSRTVPALDRWRIRVLARLLESDSLDCAQRHATCAMLAQKIEIFSAGASKRGRHEEVRELRTLRERLPR